MIQKGSIVILRTNEATYSPCEVLALSKENITITFFAGTRRDRKTGEFQDVHPVETIPIKKVTYLSERL